MAGEYLITATNGMHALISTNPPPQPRQLMAAALIGCEALGQLAADLQFQHRLRTLAAHQRMLLPIEDEFIYASALSSESSAVQSQTTFGAFGTTASALAVTPADARENDEVIVLKEFLRKEEELLLSCGMRPDVIGELLEPILNQQSNFRLVFTNPEDAERAISQLHEVSCKVANAIEGNRPTQGLLGRVKKALGGSALVSVNISAWALSMGLTLPFSALSGAIGVVTILNAAIEEK